MKPSQLKELKDKAEKWDKYYGSCGDITSYCKKLEAQVKSLQEELGKTLADKHCETEHLIEVEFENQKNKEIVEKIRERIKDKEETVEMFTCSELGINASMILSELKEILRSEG